MQKYRKKPIVVEAVQFDGQNFDTCLEFCQDAYLTYLQGKPHGLQIDTIEGNMYVSPGDYIIKGVKGEFYPCKPDIFEATYDVVEG